MGISLMQTSTTLGPVELAKHLGLTYRQVYHATAYAGYVPTAPMPHQGGFGTEARVWGPEAIRRMEVAAAFVHATPGLNRGGTILPLVTRAAFEADAPPDEGWAVLTIRVAYEPNITYKQQDPLVLAMGTGWRGGIVVPLPEMWPLEEL
jgi:hypothetical protein